jgi:pyruvate carboxylase
MARALEELVIRGVETCVPFHRKVMNEEDFQNGDLSIRYLEDHPNLMEEAAQEDVLRAAAATAALLQEKERKRIRIKTSDQQEKEGFSAWKRAGRPFSGRG